MKDSAWQTTLDRYVPPGGGTLTQRISPREMARKMLAEKKASDSKVKMTWNRNKPPAVPMDRIVGDVNLNLPHAWVSKTYFVQNGSIYKSNGLDITTLEQIAVEDPANFRFVRDAFQSMKKVFLERDANACKRCAERDKFYTFEGTDDATRHNALEHPEVIQEALASIRPTTEAGQMTTPVEQNKVDWSCCGNPFDSKLRRDAHRRFSKSCPSRG